MSNTKSEIEQIIIDFSNENLNEEFKNKSIEILEKLEETNKDILSTSRTDIWAASILSAVLDVNGVFGKKHPMYMTKKDFSQKAGVSAGTIKNKADSVKEILNIVENDERVIISSTEESTKKVEVKEEVAVTAVEVKDEKEAMYQNFMTLGHASDDYQEKADYFEQAIKVAVDMIVDKKEVVYWEDEVTRPYMIALQDLGNTCLLNKDYEAATRIYELLLNLNPLDHQGIRYKLVNILIKKNDRKEINELFLRYKEDKSSMWLYSKVLYYYKNKNEFMAKDTLKEAVNRNKYIALKLIKWTAFMQMSGVYINPALFDEANYYCEESIDLWKSTKGSIDWLLKNVLKK
ncbi:MAG: DUF6398 domain-containing protein [Terrisporobacter sp.]|uniref:DUF6398 domain-containing protein n=1 Tax=Terrisporobacter sp. TaxID=1965305 RepID=UPI002FC912DA